MEHNEINERITEASKTILTYCLARTSCREDAEDLAQEILLNLARSLPNLRDSGAFYGFMWGLAGNVYKQWYRKKLRHKTEELIEDIPSEEELFPEENDEVYLLRRELGLLEEKFRRAAVLYYIEELGCAEIADRLAISESMVKYLLFKARKILKEGITVMERKLGYLSYNPKTLVPMYSGSGPNQWWDFLHKHKIRQNILAACCEDILTAEQISLEVGIPLPYLEDEISALEEKNILRREGKHYQTNVLIITRECAEEMAQAAAVYQERIADAIHAFLNANLEKYRAIGFTGADFSENTLRWQLATLVMREMMHWDSGIAIPSAPTTAWGEPAWIWCQEEEQKLPFIFNYSGMGGREKDSVLFFDYLPALHGDHHDFYGNEYRTNLICDVARGKKIFGEYEREELSVILSLGYVKQDGEGFIPTLPVYSVEQYRQAIRMAKDFVRDELGGILHDLSASAVRILREHSPRHLADAVVGIALMNNFFHAVARPGQLMVEKGYLRTDWHPQEMPGCYIVLDYVKLFDE